MLLFSVRLLPGRLRLHTGSLQLGLRTHQRQHLFGKAIGGELAHRLRLQHAVGIDIVRILEQAGDCIAALLLLALQPELHLQLGRRDHVPLTAAIIRFGLPYVRDRRVRRGLPEIHRNGRRFDRARKPLRVDAEIRHG